jgi:transposase
MLERMEGALTKSGVARRIRSAAEKRRIVEETHQQGASVRSVARAHDIPTNQVFHWRKLYREGRLGKAEQATDSGLVEVRILDVQQESNAEPAAMQSAIPPSLGVIQIESEKGRLCIQGAADPTTLRVVLERWLG